jgi:serine beta-lactamase-like protein LACTB, mitochondrial
MQDSFRGHLRRGRAYGLLPLVALVLAAGCAGSGDGPETARLRDKSGCRTSTRVAAFAKEIGSARPLALRMKRGFAAPGLAIAVAVHGQVVWSEVCGYADLAWRTPVTAATRFRIGSVSKTLTAAAAGRLAQEKRLDLDAPIQRYVASFPAKSHPVTARELLAHVAGIRHYQGSEALSGVHYLSVTDSLRVFARDPLLFEPGTRYSYSSYGFNLVGAAIEAIAEEDFGEAVTRLVLAPLGMQHTAIDDGRRRQSWATPYEVTEARKAIPAPSVDLSNRLPSGGFRSTAEDLARFGSRLGDDTFLRKQTQDAFFREQHLDDGSGTSYGLGFEVGQAPFGRVVGHTGNVAGGTAFVLAQPRAGVAIAMATNVGYVTARTAPDLSAVPDPPTLFAPFVMRTLRRP